MFKKFGIGMLAVVVAVAFSAFTPSSKPAASLRTTDLYWYNVNLATQQIPQNATYFSHSADVPGCSVQGTDIDCKRGFEEILNTSDGPVSDRGEAQKMTENP